MALEYAHGAIQWLSTDIATTVYTVSGLSFQPKALRFYSQGLTSAADSSSAASAMKSVGFCVSTSSRRCVCSRDANAQATMLCASIWADAAVVVRIDTTPSIQGLLDINTITSDGFTLIVDQQIVASHTVFWEAWGGADITVAVVGDIAEPAATGDVDYTATGFVAGANDQVVMFAGIQSTAAVNTVVRSDSGMCIGAASSGASADNVVVVGNSGDALATSNTDGYALSSECLAMIAVGGGNPDARAQLTQFGTDNFRLNWIARALTNRRSIFMAIKGGKWKAGSYTIDNTTVGNTATVSGLGFTPKGGSSIGGLNSEATAGTSVATDKMSEGSWSSTSARRAMGLRSEDNAANSNVTLSVVYAQMLVFPNTGGTQECAYDINSVDSDGFSVIVDDAPASANAAEWQGYLTFGDAAAPDAIGSANLTSSAGRYIGWTT